MAVGNLSNARATENPTVEGMRGKFFGEFRGYVRRRDDPKKMGRVRCFVPAINGLDSSQGWLDWAECSCAGLAVPSMNEPVWIRFEHGQVQCPLYCWGWKKGDEGKESTIPGIGVEQTDSTRVEEVSTEAGGFGIAIGSNAPSDPAGTTSPVYPYNKVFVSEGGTRIELDDSPNAKRIRIYHPAGTTILIDPDGSIHVRSKGAQHFHSEGDINFMLGEGATFKVGYPGGAGLSVGASGVALRGHQVNIMDRPVSRSPDPIR